SSDDHDHEVAVPHHRVADRRLEQLPVLFDPGFQVEGSQFGHGSGLRTWTRNRTPRRDRCVQAKRRRRSWQREITRLRTVLVPPWSSLYTGKRPDEIHLHRNSIQGLGRFSKNVPMNKRCLLLPIPLAPLVVGSPRAEEPYLEFVHALCADGKADL